MKVRIKHSPALPLLAVGLVDAAQALRPRQPARPTRPPQPLTDWPRMQSAIARDPALERRVAESSPA